MIYDLNENADTKRSIPTIIKSDFSIYGYCKETDKLSTFLSIHNKTEGPGISENDRRRAIHTSESTPQLMFSKMIYLDKDALMLSVVE